MKYHQLMEIEVKGDEILMHWTFNVFKAWVLQHGLFNCSKCKHNFVPIGEVLMSDEILCKECK